jgi:hypothetical protein
LLLFAPVAALRSLFKVSPPLDGAMNARVTPIAQCSVRAHQPIAVFPNAFDLPAARQQFLVDVPYLNANRMGGPLWTTVLAIAIDTLNYGVAVDSGCSAITSRMRWRGVPRFRIAAFSWSFIAAHCLLIS